MKRFTGIRALGAALLLTALTATGVVVCARCRGAASISTAKFGTLPSPCGKGHATGATDQGVTNSTINIAYGDDRGFSGLPGLDQEMGDAVKDMIAWCNAQGGINGRKIVGDYYDAAVTNVGSVMTQACKQDFMLVGEGFALDGTAEQTRLGCNLASVPGLHRRPGRGQRVRDVPGVAEPGQRQPGVQRVPGREALRLEDQARRRLRLHPLHPAVVHRQGRPGLHRGRVEVHPQLPAGDQLQRRGELHAVRPEAPELRRPDHLQRRHSGADPLRRLRGGEPDRLRPDLGHGLRRLHGGLRPVEHRRAWPTTSTSASPTSRSRRPRSCRPSPSTSPS